MNRAAGRFAAFLTRSVTAQALFAAGALLFPAFLFQGDLGVRWAQVLLFIVLAWLSGRRIRVFQTLLVAAAIVGSSLLIPEGLELLPIRGRIGVTDIALRDGMARATAVTGMIAISQFSIRPDLRLPGTLGGVLARSLLYFERIMARGKGMRRASLLRDIDDLLLSVHGSAAAQRSEGARPVGAVPGMPAPSGRSTPAGIALLVCIVGINWAVLGVTHLHPGLLWAR